MFPKPLYGYEEGYVELYQKIALQIGILHEIGLPLTNPNHFRSLWQWYSDWSSHSGSDSSEQDYVDNLYRNIVKALRQYSSSQDEVIQNLKQRSSHQEPSQAATSISTSPVVAMNTLDEEPAEVTSLAKDVQDIKFPSSLQAPVQGTVPTTMPTTQSKEGLTDFAIITAIEVERRAVCRAFELTDQHRVFKGSRVYWRNRLALKDGKFYEVVVTQSPDMTNVDAALLAAETIHQWQPSAMLMVGIAGAASENQKLGDLILGSDVHYYERGKVTPNGKKPEPISYRASSTLWNRVIAVPDWQSSIPVERPDGTKIRPKIHRGVIASGEKVIADAAIRDEIASAHRKTVAVEMEGYGVNAAAWQSFNQVHCLVIRAICDLADSIKNDEWHPYAAAVAAGFAKHFLLDQPLEPKNSPDSNQANVTQTQKFTGSDRIELAELLERTGQAVSTSRRPLCIRIETNPGILDFIAHTSDINFATQLVDFLYRTDNFNALLLLCNVIKPLIYGKYADRLKIIQHRIELHLSEI